MSAEKVAFAREWYARSECPGCRADLMAVAGEGVGHVIPGVWTRAGTGRWHWASRSEIASSVGPYGGQLCSWSSDDLLSLVLIGGGFLPSLEALDGTAVVTPSAYAPDGPAAAAVPSTPADGSAP